MNEQEKTITLKVEELIDIVLEDQDSYDISRDILVKLDSYFKDNTKYFGEKFIRDYIDFLDIFNQFFQILPNLFGIMFNPAVIVYILLMCASNLMSYFAYRIEKQNFCTLCTLVNAHYILRHKINSIKFKLI